MSAPYKHLMVIDFETIWSTAEKYSLTYMTVEEYIRDPRFGAWGISYKWYGENKIRWVTAKDLPAFFASVDWSVTAVLAQNAPFDCAILSWIYDVHPCFIFDTLSMGRAIRGVDAGNSLKKLAEAFGLPAKGEGVQLTNGILEGELSPTTEAALAEYCNHDVWLCEKVFDCLMFGLSGIGNPAETYTQAFPPKELRLIDLTIRMFTEPQLVLDIPMLEEALAEEKAKREGLLKRLGVEEKDFASMSKFADVLRNLGVDPPMKESKTKPGDKLFAFAKTDALFQALLNGDNEDVALACETRVVVRSTNERTRAQRFLDIAGRGALPVPLRYCATQTLRWAGEQQINMQNMKRGSFLRKAIMAPPGYVIVVSDLSQIEPRVLAYLSEYAEMLEMLRTRDMYAAFGARMFGIPGMTAESHPLMRQSAKSAVLGCFGANTPVLTQRGWVPILDVLATDTIWDGVEWVAHDGVIDQGEKEIWEAHGIQATSDHEILTERGWVAWSAALQSPSLFQSALSLASLPACAGFSTISTTTHSCAAPVGGRGLSADRTSSEEQPHAATSVPNVRPSRPAGRRKVTTQCAQTVRTVIGCWIELARSLFAAPTPRTPRTQITAAGASPCTLRGWKIALNSSATWSPCPAGTSPSFSLTGATITRDTSRATSASALAARTWLISARSRPVKSKRSSNASSISKKRTQTYDLLNAGPRHRFTILTDAGPLIVHNCGYQLGWASFATQLLAGFLGAPPVLYSKAQAKQLGVDRAYVEKFTGWHENMKRMREIPHSCTEAELLTHCLAAKKIIDLYRASAGPVVDFWSLCQDAISRCLAGGGDFTHKCLTFEKERIVLPNGLALRYPGLEGKMEIKPDGKQGRVQWTYDGGKGGRKTLHGGKLTENVVSALARCVMGDAMLRVGKRYPVKLQAHDELGALVPEREAEEGKAWIHEQMLIEPKYLPGIPLNAGTGYHVRYGMAKK